MPPEWISIWLPKQLDAMAEHSMCQPGRPGPHGLGQLGSPGCDAFQRAKSSGDFSAALVKAPSPDISTDWQYDFQPRLASSGDNRHGVVTRCIFLLRNKYPMYILIVTTIIDRLIEISRSSEKILTWRNKPQLICDAIIKSINRSWLGCRVSSKSLPMLPRKKRAS